VNGLFDLDESPTQGPPSCSTFWQDPKSKRWHHVDSKVARDKVGNALRDAVKQTLEVSTEDHLLGGIEQTHSSASFLSETSGGGKRNATLSRITSSSLMNNSFNWNDSSSNNLFSIHGGDEVSDQSVALELESGINQPSSTFSMIAPPVAATLSCPSLIAAYPNKNRRQASAHRQSGPLVFGNIPTTTHATRSRSLGLKNVSWHNTTPIRNNGFFQQNLRQSNPNHSGEQLLGLMDWDGGANSNSNPNISHVIANSNAQVVPGTLLSFANMTNMSSSLTGISHHPDNTLSHDSLLSSEIGELQISNNSHCMDHASTSEPDSAEQLTKDIEEFLKSVRTTTQRGNTANEETDSIMKKG
jgi:hypothetical protein